MARLDRFVRAVEARCTPQADFEGTLARERAISPSLGGRTVHQASRQQPRKVRTGQLGLFEM
jgi:hypothetical protein